MRPVNLIPPEDRRGDLAPLRTGSLAYVVVGACAVALIAVVALVLTQNSITDKENEVAQLEAARDAAATKAQALAPYAEFATLQAQREQTITMLAQSRFDWERVLRELALVIPADISLTQLDAHTVGEADSGDESTSGVGTSPSVVMSGCAPDHQAVAELVAALEDIDGVTRVGLESSAAGSREQSEGATAAQTSQSQSQCSGARSNSFTLTAVFDGVDVSAQAVPATPVAPTTPTTADAAATAPPAETNSTEEQVEESKQAANLIPGTAR